MNSSSEEIKTKERGREVTREFEKEKKKEEEKVKEKDRSPSPTPSSTSTIKSSSKTTTSSTSKTKKDKEKEKRGEKDSKKRMSISDISVTLNSTGGLSSASTPRPVTAPQITPTLSPSPNALLFIDPSFDTLPWEGLKLLEQYCGGKGF